METTDEARIRKRAAVIKRKGIVEFMQVIYKLVVNCATNPYLFDKLLITAESPILFGLDSW